MPLSPNELSALYQAVPVPRPIFLDDDEVVRDASEVIAECVRLVSTAQSQWESLRQLRAWSKSLMESGEDVSAGDLTPLDEEVEFDDALYNEIYADLAPGQLLDFRRALVDRVALGIEMYGRRAIELPELLFNPRLEALVEEVLFFKGLPKALEILRDPEAERGVTAETLLDPRKRLEYISEDLMPRHLGEGGWKAVATAFRRAWQTAGLNEDDMPYNRGNPDELSRKVRRYLERRKQR